MQEYMAGSRLRERLLRAAAATKKDWRSRLAVVQSEEAALRRKLEALAGEAGLCSWSRWIVWYLFHHSVSIKKS